MSHFWDLCPSISPLRSNICSSCVAYEVTPAFTYTSHMAQPHTSYIGTWDQHLKYLYKMCVVGPSSCLIISNGELTTFQFLLNVRAHESNVFVAECCLQEPTSLRNHQLLFLKDQLQKRLEELQKEVHSRNMRPSGPYSSPKLSASVMIWTLETFGKHACMDVYTYN